MKVITIIAEKPKRERLITTLSQLLCAGGQQCVFAKSCEHLAVDTPGKDSYELFEAGLDFAMLVTDKHYYLKSCHKVSDYLPIPPDSDWIIQDGEVYPADVFLTINEDNVIFTHSGETFLFDDLILLVDWLNDEK